MNGQLNGGKSNMSWDRVVEIAGDPVRLARYLGRLIKDERVPRTAKLKLLGSGLYGWIDGDLIPDNIDALPGLGYIDDVILLVHGIKCLIAETDKTVAVELWPGDEASFKRVLSAVAWLDNQLFERARNALGNLLTRIFGPHVGPSSGRQT
jgi:uncharacterized membrane protein YkvA (DUF1232 family)